MDDNAKIDAAIAEKVMGWEKEYYRRGWLFVDKASPEYISDKRCQIPPSGWLVADFTPSTTYDVLFKTVYPQITGKARDSVFDVIQQAISCADTFPTPKEICLAILEAKKG
jgi:hypothetical protein